MNELKWRENMHPDLDENFHSTPSKRISRIGIDIIGLFRWIAYYDRYYNNINYFDFKASVLSSLIQNEWTTSKLNLTQK